MDALVGGNLGNALTEEPEKLTGKDFIVAEVSSFQLETIKDFRPKVSAILNITQDHLDRYAGMEEYASVKASVFRNQGAGDYLVLNADDDATWEMRSRARCAVVPFSRKSEPVGGVYVKDGNIVSAISGQPEVIIPVADVKILGAHNLENALAAAAITLAAGAKADAVAKVLREFTGLEHRLEFVRELDGVTYINDSKGTNVGAVEKSLEGFTAPVILIAGGLDKHSDFAPLCPIIAKHVKKLILIGKAADVMEEAIGSAAETVRATTLAEAVGIARNSASPGDSVLLSPACASFDMFKDFEDRGRQFKAIVKGL
jgi:UDP-N-acetylmuramoylalanine--D-glutamate ligase